MGSTNLNICFTDFERPKTIPLYVLYKCSYRYIITQQKSISISESVIPGAVTKGAVTNGTPVVKSWGFTFYSDLTLFSPKHPIIKVKLQDWSQMWVKRTFHNTQFQQPPTIRHLKYLKRLKVWFTSWTLWTWIKRTDPGPVENWVFTRCLPSTDLTSYQLLNVLI